MKVTIYKRPETKGQFSYLAVPEEKPLPEEVTESEWEIVAHGRDADNVASLRDFFIDKPLEQIQAKGYAITSVKDREASR